VWPWKSTAAVSDATRSLHRAKGETRAALRMTTPSFPKRAQLMLPILETLQEMGGSGKPADVIASVADRFDLPADVREASVVRTWDKWGSRRRYPWRQQVHWARLDAVAKGLIGRNENGVWTLTDRGADTLQNCSPGVILTVYEAASGGEYLWADAATAAGHLADRSVNLIFSSPPYPITAGRAYGRFSPDAVVRMILEGASHWHRALQDDGSLVLNLKDCWLPREETGGAPERSLYIERLLLALVDEAKFHLADKHYWRNSASAPTTPFVTINKVRCGCDIESVLWLSKTRRPYADSREVMEPAKPSTIATYLAKARMQQRSKVCPSGQNNIFEEQITKAVKGETVLVLPRTVQTFANSDPQTKLTARLLEAGLPKHGARMPLALAKWWIKFLTRKDDLVYDPFAGSNTTGLAAEELGRRWLASDRSLAYALGSALRFPDEAVSFGPGAVAA